MSDSTLAPGHTALDDFLSAYEDLVSLREFKAAASPELEELRKQNSMLKLRVKDLRSKCEALEKRANVLSAEDEKALYLLNAEVKFKRHLDGGYTASVRAGNRLLGKSIGPRPDRLKEAVSEARKRV